MVTYEDVTELFLNAAEATSLSVHPEYWLNTQTLEREFTCALHPGRCEEAEGRASCAVSFAWGPLDTALSIEGAEGVCDFFHEPDEDCPHLHTENVPPLVLDLVYTLPLDHVSPASLDLRQLARSLKLNASERSSRAVETQPNIALSLGDTGLEADALTVQQRVELPLWDPEGPGDAGFHAPTERQTGHPSIIRFRSRRTHTGDRPRPEDWLPHLLADVVDDIAHVVAALEETRSAGR
ncbi:MAG TPA: hypothetical protein VFQ25_02310 [Ktedonobacterales bacterium]|nr:hypothetical protein [Ktedonobacterales bacterium]